MVMYDRTTLKEPTKLVDWASDAAGRKPEIAARKGTKVRLRIERLSSGAVVYTAFVKRKGRVWSMTRCVTPKGRTAKCFACRDYHGKVVQDV